MLKIGLVGLDTSHVVGFSKLLNDPANPEHLNGATVTHGYPGVSKDFELSYSRVDGFTKQLRDTLGVKIVDSPAAAAEACDLVFITAVDGRTHLDYLKQTLPYRRPTFIDKPLACSVADAAGIYRLAKEANVPLVSASSLRFAENLTEALKQPGAIVGCDIFGPMQIQPTQPGLFWYGIHIVEIASAVMGTGCKQVKATVTEGCDLIAATWADGRMVSFRGARKGHSHFGCTLHRDSGAQFVDLQKNPRSLYTSMLDAILRTLPRGELCVKPEETMEMMRIIEACNRSRETGKTEAV